MIKEGTICVRTKGQFFIDSSTKLPGYEEGRSIGLIFETVGTSNIDTAECAPYSNSFGVSKGFFRLATNLEQIYYGVGIYHIEDVYVKGDWYSVNLKNGDKIKIVLHDFNVNELMYYEAVDKYGHSVTVEKETINFEDIETIHPIASPIQTSKKENYNLSNLNIGSWYLFSIGISNSKRIAKVKELIPNGFICDGGYLLEKKQWLKAPNLMCTNNLKIIKQLALLDVQKYLPKGHPDKFIHTLEDSTGEIKPPPKVGPPENEKEIIPTFTLTELSVKNRKKRIKVKF